MLGSQGPANAIKKQQDKNKKQKENPTTVQDVYGKSYGKKGNYKKLEGPALIGGKKSKGKNDNNSTTGRKDGADASVFGSIKRGFTDPRTNSVTPKSVVRGVAGLISGESWQSDSK